MTRIAALPYEGNRPTSPLIAFTQAQPLGAASAVVIIALAALAILADRLAPYDPLDIDYASMAAAPSALHWCGTDSFGRDICSRLMFGARTALAIGIASSFLGCGIGTVIGLISAYAGGWIDLIIQRVVDVLLSFPVILIALIAVAVLGSNRLGGIDLNLIFAIAIPIVPKVARAIRAAALSVSRMAYVDAATVLGFGHARILAGHILPNIIAPLLILFSAFVAQAVLLEASLSFLGLGVTEPKPAWGLMLAGSAADYARDAPWIILFPGAAISLTVFAFNFLGDALRDWLDPRLKI